MRIERIGFGGAIAGVVLGGIIAAAGCQGGDDAVTGSDEAELHGGARFHHGHRGHDGGSVAGSTGSPAGGMGVVTGGTTGGGSAGSVGTNGNGAADGGVLADCDVCTKTQQCCDAVTPEGPTCTFSAATCASMVGDARPAYVNACLVFLMAVRGTWQGNPPAECR